jgi:hypothetical protein
MPAAGGLLLATLMRAGRTGRFNGGTCSPGQRLAIDAAARGATSAVYAGNELLGTATINGRGVVEPERLVSNMQTDGKDS